jgi:hypothetical protein
LQELQLPRPQAPTVTNGIANSINQPGLP